eukprot:TRINITY_DN6625_c0_g6_i1.p1 TRINITY_DN6625_c0_g6~~TRINITY_DN6625_c0_g6_i1.p1  ORF type:complete len:812 (+),score=140.23 TRINITY_DN6625_c0_g6_i1:100-2535(+)
MQNKKKNKKKEKKELASQESTSVDCADTTCDDGLLHLQVLSGGDSNGCAPTIASSAVLSSRDLRRAHLGSGEPALLRTNSGRCTVAVCESGGRDGSVILGSAVLQSVRGAVGDLITLTGDFEAFDADEAAIAVSAELFSSWSDLAVNGLSLDRYIAAAFDSVLLVVGDVRTLSINGQKWEICVLACQGRGGAEERSVPIESTPAEAGVGASGIMCGPWLISKRTRIRVSSSEPVRSVDAASVSPNSSGAADGQRESHGFARIGGLRGVVEELREAVQMPLERPDLYRQLGIGPPRGVLLYGPPGTGKTILAKALGEELRCPVELCASTDLIGGGIGEAEDRIKATFERCRKLAEVRGTGALLFIDEIDAVCPKRDDSGEAERRMVAAFLVALDGVRGRDDGVVVLGATNRPDAIDPALRRAGRLEREIEVGVPNAEERREILQVHMSSLRHGLSPEDCKVLARRCHGYVGADLRALCEAAGRTSLRKGLQQVDLDSFLDAARGIPPSALKELLVEVPEVRWSDIGGYETTKEALREAVEWPIKYSWAFKDMGIDPPRGVLLYGPPGCSKTMMAKAVATETEMNFVSIKGPELFSKYVGDSERAVRNVFRKARTAAPCIVFFDEIDAIGASREGEGAGGVGARVLTQLLAEMDGIGSSAGSGDISARRHVVVLAATNRPQVLDAALMRPGRFDRLVHVPLPDHSARTAILRGQLARMRISDGIDISALSTRTEWCSGAEVVMVCREAAMMCIRDALEKAEGSDCGDHAVAGGCGPSAGVDHFEKALMLVRPRIDRDTIRFYEEFEMRTRYSR